MNRARMAGLKIIAGSANKALGERVSEALGVGPTAAELSRFPDGEIHVDLREDVLGEDVFLIQSTGPPVETNLLQLLLLVDASRRGGAGRVTAVIPYFGYARQDRRAGLGALGARVVADLLEAVGVAQVIGVDLHSPAIDGFFRVPLLHLSAVPPLCEALRPLISAESVVVSPDLGAAKLAERYGAELGLPVAIVHKTRLSGSEVVAHGVFGEVAGKTPLLVDDMISTGGTIEAALNALIGAGCRPEAVVAATHALLVGPALDRLRRLPIARLVVTDTLEGVEAAGVPLVSVSVSDVLARAIRRAHTGGKEL